MRFSTTVSAAIAVAASTLAATLAGTAVAQTSYGNASPGANMRPPSEILVDCAKSPKDAVTRLPADLAAWATVYCTKEGAIFNANEKHFGAFPDSGKRASFYAGELDGKKGEAGAGSYFTAITYAPVTDSTLKEIVQVDPLAAKIFNGKPVKRLDLASNGGNAVTFLVIDPSADPFWVFPLTEKGLGSPAFFVVSLAALGRTR